MNLKKKTQISLLIFLLFSCNPNTKNKNTLLKKKKKKQQQQQQQQRSLHDGH